MKIIDTHLHLDTSFKTPETALKLNNDLKKINN